MKKVILIMVFALASFSMNATVNSEIEFIQVNEGCIQYSAASTVAEEDFYGMMGEAERMETLMDYYDMCVQAGGAENMLEPVFL